MYLKRILAFLVSILLLSWLNLPVYAEKTDPSSWDKIKSAGATLWDSAKDKAGEVYDKAKEKVPEWIDSAKDKLHDAGEKVGEFREDQEEQFWDWFDQQTNGGTMGEAEASDNSGSLAPDPYGEAEPAERLDPADVTSTSPPVAQDNAPTTPDKNEPTADSSLLLWLTLLLIAIIAPLAAIHGMRLGMYLTKRHEEKRETPPPKKRL